MKHTFAYELTELITSSHRGNGFVHAVAQRDLPYFENRFLTASKHFMKAWTLKPNNPDPACRLIRQQKSSGSAALAASDWFCVALSVDPACEGGQTKGASDGLY